MMSSDALKPGFYQFELCATSWSIPVHYQNLQPIGSGAYGQVCSAVDTRTGQHVALKKLGNTFATATHARRSYREIILLRHLRNHENIICLKDAFTSAISPDHITDIYLVTDLMPSNLNKILKTQRLSDSHVQFFAYQLLRALKYIHSAGIVHRDLKPDNIAVNEDCELEVLDFGLAREVTDEMTGYVSTRWWRAPEIMFNWMHYNHGVDMWSVGCIVAEMLLGRPLFPGKTHIDQLNVTMAVTGTPDGQLLKKLSSDAHTFIDKLPVLRKKDFKQLFKGHNPLVIDLLERMLQLDPDIRITVDSALRHKYLETYHDPADEPSAQPFHDPLEKLDLDIPQWKAELFKLLSS